MASLAYHISVSWVCKEGISWSRHVLLLLQLVTHLLQAFAFFFRDSFGNQQISVRETDSFYTMRDVGCWRMRLLFSEEPMDN